MPIKRNIARRTFSHNGKKYKEGSEVGLKGNDLNEAVKRGLVVTKQFVDPLGAESVVAPSPARRRGAKTENQSDKLAGKSHEKAESGKQAG